MGDTEPNRRYSCHAPTGLAALGFAAFLAAWLISPAHAQAATSQDWTPFVLVTGLLLVGRIANQDGLFKAAGHLLARRASGGLSLFVGATIMIGTVTALFNLDTSVAFLTPVLIYTARSRGSSEAPLLYGCLMLANAGSLFLPGSNLTNLIVLGHFHLTGAQFFSRMWLPGLAALLTTAAVIMAAYARPLRVRAGAVPGLIRPTFGLGVVAVGLTATLVLALRSPALPVLMVGLVASGIRLARRKDRLGRTLESLGWPVLIGLFGLAVALGTLGRAWSGPATVLAHTNTWGTAVIGATTAVVVNNLPAASLLSAGAVQHPLALLVGLNLGPNLFATGSLAWLLWWKTARNVGASPTIGAASRLGLIAVPLSMVAALGLLDLH